MRPKNEKPNYNEYVALAISEQCRGFVVKSGTNQVSGSKRLRRCQFLIPKRRTENILIEMIDNIYARPITRRKRKRKRKKIV